MDFFYFDKFFLKYKPKFSGVVCSYVIDKKQTLIIAKKVGNWPKFCFFGVWVYKLVKLHQKRSQFSNFQSPCDYWFAFFLKNLLCCWRFYLLFLLPVCGHALREKPHQQSFKFCCTRVSNQDWSLVFLKVYFLYCMY